MQKKHQPFCIYGKHAVSAFLESHPRLVRRVYVRDTVPDTELTYLRKFLNENKVPLTRESDKKFLSLVGEVNHQGVVAEVTEFPYTELDTFLKDIEGAESVGVVLLDQLEDPHNVGAIVRSAVASGMSAVIIPRHHQSPVNGTVFKTSAGTISTIPIILVSNISYAADALKKSGFWVAGLAMDGETYWDADLKGKMAFVVGGEGEGLRHGVSENCDMLLSIPMSEGVESLNASVAASLMMYEWRRQRGL